MRESTKPTAETVAGVKPTPEIPATKPTQEISKEEALEASLKKPEPKKLTPPKKEKRKETFDDEEIEALREELQAH